MKNKLIALNHYRLDQLSFGELIKRHGEDLAKIPAANLTDAPAKTYIAGLANRSVVFDKALMKIMFNEETKKIEEADTARDLSFTSLVKAIKVFRTSDLATELEASRVLIALLNNYKDLNEFSYEKESNGIDNLIADLESTAFSKHVTTLALSRYVTRLKTNNASFRTLFANRVSAVAGKEVFDTKGLRKDLADYYNEFCNYIQAMANASTAPAQFITILNLINTARKYYADKLAQHEGVIESQKKAKATPPQMN